MYLVALRHMYFQDCYLHNPKLILKERVKPYHHRQVKEEKVVNSTETLEPFRLSFQK